MIKVLEKKKKNKKAKAPYYKLKFHYMIGDGNGNTNEEVNISVNNPFLERFVTLLDKLEPCKGSWGVQLEDEDIYGNYKEGRITEDDYKFLGTLMFDGWEDEEAEEGEEYKLEAENDDHTYEFFEGVRAEAEYSFLVFEGVTLKYVNEYGEKFNTEIIED